MTKTNEKKELKRERGGAVGIEINKQKLIPVYLVEPVKLTFLAIVTASNTMQHNTIVISSL